MISPVSASQSVPGVRRPRLQIGGGSALAGIASAVAGADPWSSSIVALRLQAAAAPHVDWVEIVAHAEGAPEVVPGDELAISLGYEDEGAAPIFTGMVDGVARSLGGTVRIGLTNAGATLARQRVRKSFERQTAGEIVTDLVRSAGASMGRGESGVALAFYALDDRRGAWSTIAELARQNGFLAWVAPDGKVRFGAPGGTSVQTFRYGQDVMHYECSRRQAPLGSVTVHGEGAAGGQGQDAWGWLIKDPSSVTARSGDGTPERFLSAGALRSAEAAEKAASALLAAAAASQTVARIHVAGAPGVTVGDRVEVAAMTDEALNGSFLVHGVRHDYDKRVGFRSRFDLVSEPSASVLPGGFL